MMSTTREKQPAGCDRNSGSRKQAEVDQLLTARVFVRSMREGHRGERRRDNRGCG